jgi:hypothetical protein
MGISTDAILAYGYDLGYDPVPTWWSNLSEEEQENEGFADLAKTQMLASIGFTEKWAKGNEGYFDRKREAKKQLGVEVIYYCSYDYPMYILAAKEFRAYRGDVEIIDSLDIDLDWDDKLKSALKSLEIKPINEHPQWMLVSMWG